MNPCTKLYPVILYVDWFSVHTFDVKKMFYIWLVPVCWLVLCILTDTLYLRVRPEILHDVWKAFYIWLNLTTVRPLFSLSHTGSDNSSLLIMFRANHIDQSIVTFIRLRVFRKIWPFDPSRLHYMPEVTGKRNNKTTYIIFKNTALHLNTLPDWSKSWCNMQTTKFTWTRSVMGSYQILYAIE